MRVRRTRTSGQTRSRAPRAWSPIEALEPRIVLAAFEWTPEEVLLAELVNRARMDPIAEGARLNLDLADGLTSEQRARLVPQEPLALNEALTLAARGHNADMAARRFFAHENPDGLDPSDRARNAGYAAGAGENIAAGQAGVEEAHAAWLDSLGHRLNVLSLHENFSSSFHYNELGVGVLGPPVPGGEFRSYFGQLFGVVSGDPYLLGVVHNDLDGDDFYDIGEGVGGVRIEVTRRGTGELVASYESHTHGNYQIRLPADTAYTVTFISPETGLVKMVDVTLRRDNVKIDAETNEFLVRAPVDATVHADIAPGPSYAPDGRLAVGVVNAAGDVVVTRRAPSGGWLADNLSRRTDAPRALGDAQTWHDAKDGRLYAAAPTADGLALFTLTGETWTLRNLSEELGAGIVLPDITVFTGRDGLVRIAGVAPTGELILFEQTTGSDADGFAWRLTDLSNDHLRVDGRMTPAFTGPLVSYVTPWGGLNIVGLDRAGDIQAVWWAPGLERWRANNLSEITGAPSLAGGLTVNQTSWNGVNLVGIDAAGRVLTTWWVPGFGANWRTSDLTSSAGGGPALVADSTTSFTTSWDGINVAGLDENGEVVVYWWAPGLSRWAVAPLSQTIDDAAPARGALRGGASALGEISLVASSREGDLTRLFWNPGGAWQTENITQQV